MRSNGWLQRSDKSPRDCTTARSDIMQHVLLVQFAMEHVAIRSNW